MNPGAGAAGSGLYVHVPFCRAVCPYCDFAVRLDDEPARGRFLEAIRLEIDRVATEDAWAARPFDTLYLGGGTPTALADDELSRLVETITHRLPVAAGASLFIEANPEDVTPQRIAAWRDLGVRFLSLGVQSFDDATLQFLGRAHDGAAAMRAVEAALVGGIETVSVDLIFGLPGDDRDGWRRSLATTVSLGVPHVSSYQLTIHEGTPFEKLRERGELTELDEDGQGDRFVETHEFLAAAGLPGYEVSNFAAGPEHRSGHNQKYWRHVPYRGIGPSAHSFEGRRRFWNHRDMRSWRMALADDRSAVADSERLGDDEVALEILMLGLRTAEGVDLAELRRRTGADPLTSHANRIGDLQRDGLLHLDGERLTCTHRGWAVVDGIVRDLE